MSLLPRFRVPLLTAALLVACVAIARAQGGIDLSWNDCGGYGSGAKTFPCGSNTLTAVLIASAIAPVPMDRLNGEESEFLLQTNAPALSPWWHLESGGCRGTSAISTSFDFTGGPFNCLDPWSGQASGGMLYEANYGLPNRARFRTIGALAGSTSITNTDEYEFFKVTLLGLKTVGTGACAGCTDGMCIVFSSLKLTQSAGAPGGDVTLTQPWFRHYVTFQAGGVLGGNCPPVSDPVAVRRSTWGSVKSLYR